MNTSVVFKASSVAPRQVLSVQLAISLLAGDALMVQYNNQRDVMNSEPLYCKMYPRYVVMTAPVIVVIEDAGTCCVLGKE
ncbi:hypothetical protein E2C01_037098 [Portunus trituberculatus]|uniref:Uncharacterized protein n=1 Tax=Portunus trituberculatus TaxID=210409 RepID=A0A5B7F783_PORTR|nr:hypothetical protein [Portunus trituberculatus]